MKIFSRATVLVVFAFFLSAAADGATVAYWRFEEGIAGQSATGSVLDSSPNGLNGTPHNSPIYDTNVDANPIAYTGAPNKLALQFNGGNQFVSIPDNPLFYLTNSLTLEAYIKVFGIGQSDLPFYIIFRGDDRLGLDPYWLALFQHNGTNFVYFQICDDNNNPAYATAILPAFNEWLHVAGTFDVLKAI